MPRSPSTAVSASGLGHQAHAELAQDRRRRRTPRRRRSGRARGAAGRGRVGRRMSSGGGGGRRSSIDAGGVAVGSVHEDRPDAARAEVVDGELEQRLEHVAVAVRRRRPPPRRSTCRSAARGASVRPSQRNTPNGPTTRTAPVGWRWTMVAPIASASTTRSRSEPAGRSNTAHSSSPSSRRISQLDRPSANSRVPAGRQRLDRAAHDGQLGARLPRGERRRRLDDRADARHPSLVHLRPQGVVDLGDHQLAPLRRQVDRQADLGELLRQAAQPRRAHRPPTGRATSETSTPDMAEVSHDDHPDRM